MSRKFKNYLRTAFVLCVFLIIVVGVVALHLKKRSIQPQVSSTASTSTEGLFAPEIPINEYWDYANLQGLRLYVNNTDRNVIYALNDRGKIAWVIQGKDYGIDGYEIRHSNHQLFLTGSHWDSLKGHYSTLWVFGMDGKLRWKHLFDGYLDMPKMLLMDSLMILENSSMNTCDRGCGITCKKQVETEICHSDALWAFDVDTGRLVWKNTTRDFYPWLLERASDGNIVTRSGGVGPGRWRHDYTVSSTTGVIKSHSAIVNDVEFGQDRKHLIWDENAQTVALTMPYSSTTYWTVKRSHPLYKLVLKGKTTGLEFYVLDDLIVARLHVKEGIMYGINKMNGKILWTKNFDSPQWSSWKFKTLNQTMVMEMTHHSRCVDICDTCPKNSSICFDTAEPKECTVCKGKEESAPGYSRMQIWGVDAKTGNVLWKFNGEKNYLYIDALDKDRGTVTIDDYKGATSTFRVLDILTGRELP
ncbi:MAG: hypothetical protein Q7N87_04850 [Candidatus Uhrbacteria bacterium]|nr:hypothetical protein [Candidatus Uhrbacteria bacterium]